MCFRNIRPFLCCSGVLNTCFIAIVLVTKCCLFLFLKKKNSKIIINNVKIFIKNFKYVDMNNFDYINLNFRQQELNTKLDMYLKFLIISGLFYLLPSIQFVFFQSINTNSN